jgi:hypothetical protein
VCSPTLRPLAQQLFDCSDGDTEVCGLASVQLFASRAPSALLLHDGSGTTGHLFLFHTVARLDDRYPEVLVADANLNGRDLRGRVVGVDARGRARPHPEVGLERLASVLGLCAHEIRGLIATARAVHVNFMPSLPDPTVIGPVPDGITVEAASDPIHRLSGYLLSNRSRSAALVLHDADPSDSHRVDDYLTSLLRRFPGLAAWNLAERSLRDPGDAFCRVIRTEVSAATPRLRSTSSMELASAASMVGTAPPSLARLVDRVRDLRRWCSPFRGVRPLPDEPVPRPSAGRPPATAGP